MWEISHVIDQRWRKVLSGIRWLDAKNHSRNHWKCSVGRTSWQIILLLHYHVILYLLFLRYFCYDVNHYSYSTTTATANCAAVKLKTDWRPPLYPCIDPCNYANMFFHWNPSVLPFCLYIPTKTTCGMRWNKSWEGMDTIKEYSTKGNVPWSNFPLF